MLSRKTSNALFYGSLVIILVIVLLIRVVSLGTLNARIDDVTANSRSTQAQIELLEQIVQDNKDLASDHLYALYERVPETFNQTELSYFTYAQLDQLGISEDPSILRSVDISDNVTFPVDSIFVETKANFKVVEVEVYFNTTDVIVVDQFIDMLYSSQQVFIVNAIEYVSPDGENSIGVTINFLAFYKL